MWHEEWGGLPSEEFLVQAIHSGWPSGRLYQKHTSDKASDLTSEWAAKLGLPAGFQWPSAPLMPL